jgi:putative copper export protein
VYQAAVSIHVLSAIVWVGGLVFLALVAVPATRPLPAAERGALLNALGRRFRPVGWVCLGLLVLTGLVVSGYRGLTWETFVSGAFFGSPFGRLLAIKLGLVALMALLTLAHDLWLGPASARALAAGESATGRPMAGLRRASAWTARLSLIVALAVVFLGVALVRGLP